LNEGLKKIGIEVFQACQGLERIVLPSTVTRIGKGSFRDCAMLNSVVLNEGLQMIGEGVFERCRSLRSITIPSSINEINDHVFTGCSSLQSIMLPTTVTKVGDMAFRNCSQLREVGLSEETQEIGQHAFGNCPRLKMLALPHLSMRVEAIMQDSRWEEISNKIDNIMGVQRRGSKISLFKEGSTWPCYESQVDSIVAHISYPEMKAATTLFELALWKAKIGQQSTNDHARSACRVEVPGPVKDLILKYAYRIPVHTTTHYRIFIKIRLEPYDLEPSDTIADLKKKIFDKRSIPVDRQQLFFRGDLLHDNDTISECNIQMDQ